MSGHMKSPTPLSRGKKKILEVLANFGEVNISKIIKHTSLNHKLVNTYLKEMESLGLVRERRFGRVRMFRLSDSDVLKRMLRNVVELEGSSWVSQP
ncbi:MAG: helix-turn-helix domain-containing protein [Nitrososphaerota archaeon]